MKKQIAVSVIFILTIISCKKNNQISNLEKLENQETTKILSIKFNFKTNKSDVFKIMVNNIEIDELQKMNIQIIEEVTPSSEVDEITAKFETDNISNNVLIHLGNEEVKEVEIVNISASYGKNQINIKTPQEQNKYLVFNKFIEKDSTSNKLRTKRVNGAHNPVIYFNRNLINLLKKE